MFKSNLKSNPFQLNWGLRTQFEVDAHGLHGSPEEPLRTTGANYDPTSQKCAAVPRRARILRRMDFVYHATLGLRVIKKKKNYDPEPAAGRGGNHSNGFQHFRTEIGPRQDQNLALTVFCVPRSLDSG